MEKTRTGPWNALDYLATDEDVFAYLEAAFDDGDPQLIALAHPKKGRPYTPKAPKIGFGRRLRLILPGLSFRLCA